MLRRDVLPKWHWRDGRTITSREIIELLDKVVERGPGHGEQPRADARSHVQVRDSSRHSGELSRPVALRPGGKPRAASASSVKRSCGRSSTLIRSAEKRQRVLMVLLLTMQRRGEFGIAEWTEFDFATRGGRFRPAHKESP